MLEFIEKILSPFIYVIKNYYLLMDSLFSFPAISIVFTSLSISIFLLPILRVARVYEDNASIKINHIQEKLKEIPPALSGEQRFRAIEEIYNKNNFHPIHNIYTGISFYTILPILLSAYLFFLNNINIFDVSAFNIINLSQPDKFLGNLNLLPILIFITNYVDSSYRYYEIKSGQNTYLIISFFICILIYNMPSCMTLYWLTSSIFSLFMNLIQSRTKLKKH